jgi:hypothetical protein
MPETVAVGVCACSAATSQSAKKQKADASLRIEKTSEIEHGNWLERET